MKWFHLHRNGQTPHDRRTLKQRLLDEINDLGEQRLLIQKRVARNERYRPQLRRINEQITAKVQEYKEKVK